MTLPKHLNEAVARLEEAARRIDQAREKKVTTETLYEWLGAVTDYAFALNEVHKFNNESIHEKLNILAGRTGLKQFPSASQK